MVILLILYPVIFAYQSFKTMLTDITGDTGFITKNRTVSAPESHMVKLLSLKYVVFDIK